MYKMKYTFVVLLVLMSEVLFSQSRLSDNESAFYIYTIPVWEVAAQSLSGKNDAND